jgi:hypothetical protein
MRISFGSQAIDGSAGLAATSATSMAENGQSLPPRVFACLEGTTALEERNVRDVYTRVLEKAALRQIRIHDPATHLRDVTAASRSADHVRERPVGTRR